MSTHPNALLILAMTPDDLARKTYREILESIGVDADDSIKVGNDTYHHRVFEDDYDQSHQISANEGDIVLWDCVTYGYGDTIDWDKLAAQKAALEEWAKSICEKHHCKPRIYISANYW